MRVLTINTCGGAGVAALADEDGVVAQEALPGRGTSEALMPAVRRLFSASAWTLGELGAVGVVNGPGSFTGVRVGLSAAKGLCEAAGIGMVAMSRLGLVAAAGEGERVVAVLDGGRGEFYCGVYAAGERVSEELVTVARVRELMRDGVAVTCEERVASALGIALVAEPGAEAMQMEVLRRIAVGDWSDVAASDANYLRRTDAEIKKASAYADKTDKNG
jgi:tRNA threonylcarbamoyladenosine biosynthesis protein TsaB